MGHVPMNHGVDFNPHLAHHVAKAAGAMGVTAELLARMHGITRAKQDDFAEASHRKAHEARIQNKFINDNWAAKNATYLQVAFFIRNAMISV